MEITTKDMTTSVADEIEAIFKCRLDECIRNIAALERKLAELKLEYLNSATSCRTVNNNTMQSTELVDSYIKCIDQLHYQKIYLENMQNAYDTWHKDARC